MNKRHVLILAAVALSLAAWFASHREQQRFGVTEGELLVPQLATKLASIDAVSIQPAGNDTTTLVARDGQWLVVERGEYPADTTALRKELRKLAEARRVEAKTAQAAFYPQLGVEDVAEAEDTTVRLTARAGNEPVLDLIIGKSAASGSYVRLLDDPQSWLIDQRIALPRVTVAWLDNPLLSVARNDVQRMEIEPLDGPDYAIHKDDPEQTDFALEPALADSEQLNAANVNRLGAALSSLRIEDVVADIPAELRWSAARVSTFDGLVLDVSVAKSDDNTRYLRVEARATDEADDAVKDRVSAINSKASGRTFLGPQYSVDALSMTRAMLIRQPQPAPED